MSALLLMHSNAGCAARKRNLGLFARHRSLIRQVARAAANRDMDEVLGAANFSGYPSVADFKAYAAYAAQYVERGAAGQAVRHDLRGHCLRIMTHPFRDNAVI